MGSKIFGVFFFFCQGLFAYGKMLEVRHSNGHGGGMVDHTALERSIPGFTFDALDMMSSLVFSAPVVVTDLFIVHREARIGAHTLISQGAVIGERSMIGRRVQIGESVQIGQDVVIHDGVKINDESFIGWASTLEKACILGQGVVIRRRNILKSFVSLGPDVRLGCDNILHESVDIRRDCRIGNNNEIHQHTLICSSSEIIDGVAIAENVTIKRGVFLYKKSRIKCRSTLDEYTVLGKEAIVGQDVYIGKRNQIQNGARIRDGDITPHDFDSDVYQLDLEDAEDDADSCLICLEKKKTLVAFPCRHFAYCQKCSQKIEVCALCRIVVQFFQNHKTVNGQVYEN